MKNKAFFYLTVDEVIRPFSPSSAHTVAFLQVSVVSLEYHVIQADLISRDFLVVMSY